MSIYGFSNLEQTKVPFPVSECVKDVELASCSYGTHGDYEFIDFTYVRKTEDGIGTLRDRMFSINESNINPNPNIEGDTKEMALKRAGLQFVTRLKHIASKFGVSDDELKSLPNSSFAAMAKSYCNMVNANCEGIKMYCKTVKDKAGYTKMAKYPPFLQRMDAGDCELKYSASEVSSIAANTPSNGAVKGTRKVSSWTGEDLV